MKKIMAFILCLCLMSQVMVFASGEYDDAISRVSGIGIMGNVSDGNFRPDDNITRAEFTAVALRMLGIFSCPQSATVFSDVPYEHWASGHVAIASDMGLINGKGDGIFAPEDNVTYSEAVKIMVCALGRDLVMQNPVYPDSYLAEAGTIGLTKGFPFKDGALTRAEVAYLVDNALDIKPLEQIYGAKITYKIAEKTLFEKLSDIRDTEVYSGILTESRHTSIRKTPELKDGFIMVDSESFKTDKDVDALIGQYVDVYYTKSGSVKNVVHIAPQASVNNIYTLNSQDTKISSGKIYYTDADEKEKSYTIDSDAKFVLNGDTFEVPSSFTIDLGNYILVDNDDNRVIDLINVTRAESFIAESVSLEGSAVYFENNRTYHGRNGIALDYEDDEKEYVIVDKDGNAITLEDISAGDAVSIVGNSNDTFVKIIVNSEIISGSVTGISDDEVFINDKSYEIGKDITGKELLSPYLGMEGDFVIDAFGFCIGTSGSSPDKFTYGYIADAIRTKDMDSGINIKIVTGMEPQKNVKISNGDETISYYLQNEEIKVYSLADSVKYKENPIDARGVKTDCDDIDPESLKEKIVGFTLNAEGKINALNVYSVPANLFSCEFNAEIFSFGGMRVTRGYVKDEDTQIVCVPNLVRDEDDYGVRVQITDEASVNVYGIKGVYENEYGSEEAYSEPADIIIVKAEMDSSLPPLIPMDNEICIIGKISTKLSEEGDEVCVAELLNGSEKQIYEVSSDSLAFSSVKALKKGDLIQFTTNSKAEISSVRKLASVQGLTDYTDEDNLYGLVENIRYNVYDYFSNRMVDRMTVNTGNNLTNIKLFKSEGQNIYLYDRSSGYIYPATSDDIMAASYYGDKATHVFAYMVDNEAEVVVLIKD